MASKYFNWLKKEEQQQDDEETGLMTSIKGSLASTGNPWNKAQSMYEDMTISTGTWVEFGLLVGIGLFFIFASTFALMTVSLMKFSTLFTLGSVFVLLGSIRLRGFKKFQEHMWGTKDQRVISGFYIGGLFSTFYFSMINPLFIPSIVSVVIQLIALLYVMFSYIPGGRAFLDAVFGTCCGICCPKLRASTKSSGIW